MMAWLFTRTARRHFSFVALAGVLATATGTVSARAGALPDYVPNPKVHELHAAYRRSEVLVREKYGTPVPWQYILSKPDRFHHETIALAHIARQMDGGRYRFETDFTTITARKIPGWREEARNNLRLSGPSETSVAQAELAREITDFFLDRIDNDYRNYGGTSATISDALLLARTLDQTEFYTLPQDRGPYGPNVSSLRAQAIITDAFFSHADIFMVDSGVSSTWLVERGAELAAYARINEFDSDHPAALRFRYLRSFAVRLDGSYSGDVITDSEVDARVALLDSLDILETNPYLRAPVTFVANEDTVDYVRTVSGRLSTMQVLRILHALSFAGRPPRDDEPGMTGPEAQYAIAKHYLDTANPSLVDVYAIPKVIAYVSPGNAERNRALVAWAEANRGYHSIPGSFADSIRPAGNAAATRAELAELTRSQRPPIQRSLSRLQIYDSMLRERAGAGTGDSGGGVYRMK